VDSWNKALLYLACSGLVILGITGSVLPLAAQQAAAPEQDLLVSNPVLTASADQPSNVTELPDSPGTTVARAAEAKQQNTTQQQSGQAPPPSSQPSGAGAQSNSQTPVGTAVAETPTASGIAASQPAGVAIAPAKQRRVRTIVLRMGAIVGAGVAVGSVVALTAATSSKPPGAH
jgi:cytoskeletal protein RodZ